MNLAFEDMGPKIVFYIYCALFEVLIALGSSMTITILIVWLYFSSDHIATLPTWLFLVAMGVSCRARDLALICASSFSVRPSEVGLCIIRQAARDTVISTTVLDHSLQA